MNKHIFLEPTLLGAKLNLTYEQEHMCKVVYKKDSEGDGHFFDSLWDASGETQYNDDYIIVPFRSTYSGKFDFDVGWQFVNIIGSAGDPKPVDPKTGKRPNIWIPILRDNGCTVNCCVTDGKFYLTDTNAHDGIHVCNTPSLVGGHVITGERPQRVALGGSVNLVSICQQHNVTGNSETNQHYMRAGVKGIGALLANYMLLERE